MTDERRTVLAVDDESDYLDVYTSWLEDEYEVRTATDGEAALDAIGDDIDVVLLDRLMPGLSGDEVLEEIRRRGVDTRVAMITAVAPELDIIDLGFDDYLVKPVSRDELEAVVRSLLTRSELDETVRECYSLASKKATLEARMEAEWLEAQPEYIELTERLSAVTSEADTAIDELREAGKPETAYLDIT